MIWRGSIGTKGFDTQRNPKKMLKNKKPKMDFLTLGSIILVGVENASTIFL